MNVVFIVPTGVGAEIGGHAGDATPAARLIGSVCDRIILHPNVVNASDINEMPPNTLYVDGYALDKFLSGEIGLQPVRSNKVLVAVNPPQGKTWPPNENVVNAVSACRITLGVDASIVVLHRRLIMRAGFNDLGIADGSFEGTGSLIAQVKHHDFDALAVISEIEADRTVALDYLKHGGVNPWGAIEALTCRDISQRLQCPVAHAPIDSGHFNDVSIICDPRMAAEFVSVAYLFCVIKGLHKAPRWTTDTARGLWVDEVDLLVSPDMKFGIPHQQCIKHNIPILIVEENKTVLPPAEGGIRVANYTEAAGWVASMRAGIDPRAVRRPFESTKIVDTDEIIRRKRYGS
jgi:hypothetical protein